MRPLERRSRAGAANDASGRASTLAIPSLLLTLAPAVTLVFGALAPAVALAERPAGRRDAGVRSLRAAAGCPVRVQQGDLKRVTPGAHYDASALHELVLGKDYRRVWATPVEVPVLDLSRYDGGLSPKGEGGGKQSMSLELESGNGQQYRFRSVDKEPTRLLPRALRATVAGDVLQDQTAAALPAASLVVGALLDRVGVPNAKTELMVLPDDDRLGEFRKEFGGMLGTLEPVPEGGRTPTPGFEDVSEVLSTEKLFDRFALHPEERIDTRLLLKARLVDLLVGDWDRHEKQWRWGRSRRSGLWLPIPRDRDQAFTRFEGLALGVARLWAPRLMVFSPEYSAASALGWNSRDFDRALLPPLAWPDWQRAVAEVQGALDDEAIRSAVCRLPPEHHALVGAQLVSALRARRDALPGVAAEFYRLLSEQVDVFATAGDDVASIERRRDGAVRLRLSLGSAPPWFDRLFVPNETREVRVYLGAGDDRLTTSGAGPRRIRLRVVGGDGGDALSDAAALGVRFYDLEGAAGAGEGEGVRVDRREWNPPNADEENRPLDWGHTTTPVPWLGYQHDVGAVLGAGVQFTTYGFRQYPYAHRHTLRAGHASGPGEWRFEYTGDFRRRGALEPRRELVAVASGFEVFRFYGFGNEHAAAGPDERYKVHQREYLLSPALVLPLPRGTLSLGPLLRFARTDLEPGQLLTELQPYGIGHFGQVGARGALRLDLRDRPDVARRGFLLTAEATAYPAVWSVERPFGDVRTALATYVPLPLDGSLALRAGGQQVWGRYPFHEAAFVGSWDTVRGLPLNRYAGDRSLFANAELRAPLTDVGLFLQGRLGVFALLDVGRVYLDGESSGRWHHGVGGGAWLSFEKGTRTLAAAVARSEGHVSAYLVAGMQF